jgi:hypothetical protein
MITTVFLGVLRHDQGVYRDIGAWGLDGHQLSVVCFTGLGTAK